MEEEKVCCVFCGKPLKNLKSKKLGYGPGCYKKYVKSKAYKRKLL